MTPEELAKLKETPRAEILARAELAILDGMSPGAKLAYAETAIAAQERSLESIENMVDHIRTRIAVSHVVKEVLKGERTLSPRE